MKDFEKKLREKLISQGISKEFLDDKLIVETVSLEDMGLIKKKKTKKKAK
tara:strand:+ start:310 stop:459 length:150 start_codon:yes stop_codon:yes gene_type:complete